MANYEYIQYNRPALILRGYVAVKLWNSDKISSRQSIKANTFLLNVLFAIVPYHLFYYPHSYSDFIMTDNNIRRELFTLL